VAGKESGEALAENGSRSNTSFPRWGDAEPCIDWLDVIISAALMGERSRSFEILE
jgi:hypothetical protein